MCCKLTFLITFQYFRFFFFFYCMYFQNCLGKKPDKMISVCLCLWFSDRLCGSVCTERLDSRLWLSACLNQEYTGCVPALRSVWGPLRRASGFRLHAPNWLLFVWLKHSETLGFLKMQCHFRALFKESHLMLITSYSIDETLLFWWDHLTLMGPFCVINIWMGAECQCCSLTQSTLLTDRKSVV